MYLFSPAFHHLGIIPEVYTFDGPGVIPPLIWGDIPESTASLALTIHDDDVPPSRREDRRWEHLTVINMEPTEGESLSGEIPLGETLINTRGEIGWCPPAPPDRAHRYIFQLFALSEKLLSDTNRLQIESLGEKILARSEIIGLYERSYWRNNI